MFEVVMPQLGLTMETGAINSWLKDVGDTVEVGDVLCEVETDKLTNELESEFSGVLRAIVAPAGADVPVLGLLALIGSPDEPLVLKGEAPAAPPAQAPSSVGSGPAAAALPAPDAAASGRVRASGLAKKMASEGGVDLTAVVGTGAGGRVIARDVEAAKAIVPVASSATTEVVASAAVQPVVRTDPSTSGSTDGRRERMTGIRRTIARRMHESWTTVPAVTYDVSADMVALTDLKNTLLNEHGKKVSFTHLLAALVSRALVDFPLVNCSIDGDDLVFHDRVDLGIAVAIPDGLVVPVVRNAHHLGIGKIAEEINDLARRARSGELSPDEIQGGTFTITNLAMFGVESFSPIINLPEVAILGVGATVMAPVEESGSIVLRPRMKLSLTADHRAVDGAVAAQFLSRVCALIEKPMLMMV